MKANRQTWILVGILCGVFLLGFFSGISTSRPLRQWIPERSPAQDPKAEEFVQNFSTRMTQHLNLTDDQRVPIEEIISQMSEQIRNEQRTFIPKISQILMDHIDKMLPLLNEEQQATLQRQRANIATHPPLNQGGPPGAWRGGPGNNGRPNWAIGGAPQGGPPRGPRPWGNGPPPWAQEGQPGSGPPSQAESNRPARPPMEQ